MVPVVLPNDLLAVQLPKARIVVRAGRDKVCRVGAESTVPHPSLVTLERGFERVRLRLLSLTATTRVVVYAIPRGRQVAVDRGAVCLCSARRDAIGVRKQRRRRLNVADLPDFGGVVGAAGCEFLDVG
jgi:hypothetical protein